MNQDSHSTAVKVTAMLHAKIISLTETEYFLTDIKNYNLVDHFSRFDLDSEQCRMIFFENSPMQLFKKRMEADPLIDINFYEYYKMGMEDILKVKHVSKNSLLVEIVSKPLFDKCHYCSDGYSLQEDQTHSVLNPQNGKITNRKCAKCTRVLVRDENHNLVLKHLEKQS